MRMAALHGILPEAFREKWSVGTLFRPNPLVPTARVFETRKPVQVVDLKEDRSYLDHDPLAVASVDVAGIRSLIAIPMLKEGAIVGAMTIYRRDVRLFAEKQIELVTNFAAQAVIAIENARLLNELRQRTNDLTEALEQQTATSEVLQVISGSPGELEPVFAAMLASATRICEAKFGNLFLREGETFRAVAWHGMAAYVEKWQREPLIIKTDDPHIPLARLVETKQRVHVADLRQEAAYKAGFAPLVMLVDRGGARTLLIVPMLKEHALVGAIAIYRQEVRPFTDKQIALVENFAAQAVIAIENARLLNELRQSLEQQTATSDVLRVISSSPGDLEPVFTTMVEKAVRICDAKFGTLYLREEGGLRLVAGHDVPEFLEARGSSLIQPAPGGGLDVVMRTKRTVHIPDLAATQSYAERHPRMVEAVELGGMRTVIAVPMLKDDNLVGVIAVHRREVRPFTQEQIALVENFAAQAVIAIENARLLNELRQRTMDLTERTADLTEALEQQTATSDVLKVISSSPSDLQPVFDTMLANATRLCEATHGHVWTFDGEQMHAVAVRGDAQFIKWLRDHNPVRPIPGSAAERIVRGERLVHLADRRQEPAYRDNQTFRGLVDTSGIRASLSVALRGGDTLLGMINVYRQEVRPFSEKQIELVENFAAQAVIAIENARLLNELRQSLEQQTATAEVLKVVSSSPGDLQPVFASMLENATRLCEASFGVMLLHEEGSFFRAVATYNMPPAYAQVRLKEPVARPSPLTPQGRVAATKRLLHIPDVAVDVAYKEGDPLFLWFIEATGARSLVLVPMLKDDELLGVISIYRREVRPFTDKQIALVENFAAQAVIAIQNARLLNELRQRTTDLTEALEQQTATSDVLRVVSSSPSDLEPVFASMLEKAVRICDAKFANIYRWDGEILSAVASHHTPSAFVAARQRTALRPGPENPLREMVATKKAVNILDMAATASYAEGEPVTVAAVELGGVRTLLAVPILKENELIGAFLLARGEIHPFTDKQVALVTSFAAQAVIAIENTRLLKELRQRTADLAELLEQQTATANVLEVISRSAFDLHAVFETVAESSVKLCEADRGVILRFDGELLRMVATYNTSPEFEEWVAQHPIRPGRHSASARAALERRTIHIPDVRADGEYTYGAKSFEETRTILGVPILKGDNLLGVMIIYHVEEVRPFTDKQIALVETFADQAVIAIENVRLLNDCANAPTI